MTMGIPAALAFCAAWSFVAMPPGRTGPPRRPPAPPISAVMASTRVEPPGGGIVARVARVEPVDVGEEHEEVGVDQARHQRGEVVVVADLDLLDRHRVVLVDHRAARSKPSSASSVFRAFR